MYLKTVKVYLEFETYINLERNLNYHQNFCDITSIPTSPIMSENILHFDA